MPREYTSLSVKRVCRDMFVEELATLNGINGVCQLLCDLKPSTQEILVVIWTHLICCCRLGNLDVWMELITHRGTSRRWLYVES